MSDWLRQFALIALLAAVPLQGFAAAIAPLVCAGTQPQHGGMTAGVADHEHVTGHHAAGHHSTDTGKGAGDSSKHFECHHVLSGVPVKFQSPASSDPPIFRSTLSSLATLHIPESPQRPPRS